MQQSEKRFGSVNLSLQAVSGRSYRHQCRQGCHMTSWKLWTLLRRAQAEIEAFSGEFPLTKAALHQFECALKAETPEGRKGV